MRITSGRCRATCFESLEDRRLLAVDLAAELAYRLNRVRVNPNEFAEIAQSPNEWASVTSVQPLAMNPQLSQAAQLHAERMAGLDFFDVQDPETLTLPNQRARQAGYDLPDALADSGNDIETINGGSGLASDTEVLADWLNDSQDPNRQQRALLLGIDSVFASNNEFGIGFANDSTSTQQNHWVIDVTRRDPVRSPVNAFVTGVVFTDRNGNGQYDADEGISDLQVVAGTGTATTDASGWYAIAADPGVQRVILSGDGLAGDVEQLVAVENDNVQVDFIVPELNASDQLGRSEVNFRTRTLWTNPVSHVDSSNDGIVSPRDALVIINRLNRDGNGQLPQQPGPTDSFLIDTNGDGSLSPIDALLVINFLNRQTAAPAEGEAESTADVNDEAIVVAPSLF
ncbi:MAG: dockerin type I domain-containing protein [Planctomycetota bacterium]